MKNGGRGRPGTAVALGVVLVAGVGALLALSRGGSETAPQPILAGAEGAAFADAEVTVYKSASCQCCSRWVEHLQANGFAVNAVNTEEINAVKARYGVDAGLASCHTAVVDGYVIEGHVPADLVARLLEERPEVAGLAVPGMPMGSPGMEGPRQDRYDVLAFDADGNTSVYASR